MPSGGARPGTGPKPGSVHKATLSKRQEQEILRQELLKHKDKYITALLSAIEDKEVPALKEFAERAFGKVLEEVDVTSAGQPIVLPASLLEKNGIEPSTRQDSE